MKFATALIVGWSNRMVYGSSVLSSRVKVVENSLPESESSPADMSGASAVTAVPCAATNAAKMVASTEAVRAIGSDYEAVRKWFCVCFGSSLDTM